MKRFKFLAESIDPSDICCKMLDEENALTGLNQQSLYVIGPYIVAEKRNKNGRIYAESVIKREVEKFADEKIKNNRAGGEMNHPDSPSINLERISHYIMELQQEGNIWYGKSKIASTPLGEVAKALINDGFQFGVSTRGLGTVADDGEVGDDFQLITIDLISDPSAHDAFVEAVNENVQFVMENGHIRTKPVDQMRKKMATLPKKDRTEYLVSAMCEFISSLKGMK